MYKFLLAIRYLLKRRLSYFCVLATALCVFVVFVVITVLSGLTAEFKTNTHNFVGDCVLDCESMVGFPYYDEFIETLHNRDFIEGVSPLVRSYASILYGGEGGRRYSFTASIVGILPERHNKVTGFADWLHYHSGKPQTAFYPAYNEKLSGCVPGIGMMLNRTQKGRYNPSETLPRIEIEVGAFPLTAKGALARGGAGDINTKVFYYSDHFHSGLVNPDNNLIFLRLEDAQKLCGMTIEPRRISAIHIKFAENENLSQGCQKLERLWNQFLEKKSGAKWANLLEKVRVEDWKTHSRVIIAAVETEQILMMVVFAMLAIITVFVVFVVFWMIVSHKSKDIGILKSLGVSSASVMAMFMLFALLTGIIGCILGALAGWQFLVHINDIEAWFYRNFGFQLWNRAIYAIGDIPNAIDTGVLAAICAAALTACLLGAIVPSYKAAGMRPVESLQVTQI